MTQFWKVIILIGVLFIGLLYSCQQSTNKNTLTRVENLIEHYPDSALHILSTMNITPNLDNEDYCRYILLEVQAKDKAYQDISEDTLIFRVNDFFSKRSNQNLSALSSFYSGRVLQEQGENEKAMFSYLEAESYSNKLEENYNLKGLIQTNIGYVLYNELLYEQALEHFKEAKEYFRLSHNLKNEVSLLRHIGDSYLLQNEEDSAFVYYQAALSLAQFSQDPTIQSEVFHNLGVVYKEQHKSDKAIECFKKAMNLSEDSINRAKLHLNLAQVFYSDSNKDSTLFYLYKSLELVNKDKDLYLESNLHNFISTLYEESGDYKSALKYERSYNDKMKDIFHHNESKAVLEIEKKYDYEQIRNRNNELLIHRQYTYLTSLILIITVLIVFIFFYRRYHINKNALIEADHKITQFNNLVLSFNEKENSHRNVLLKHYDILKKAAVLKSYLREDERIKGDKLLKMFNEIVYNQAVLDWEILYKTMNNLQDGFFDRLRTIVPQLDETEFRICCLLYMEFSNDDIGILMNFSKNTITSKRSSIRRKIGMENYGNIIDVLNSISKESNI